MSEQTLMKDGLNQAAINRIANSLAQVMPQFNARGFQKDAMRGIEALELKARVNHLIAVLHTYYDAPFKNIYKQLMELPEVWDAGSTRDPKAVFAAWPLIDYVAVHGLQHPAEALKVLEKLTPLFTAEYAIRPFIQLHTDVTYAQLLRWCEHDNDHVRRLASEGARPRLPWGMRLPQFIMDPAPLEPILQRLKDDESLYVRRSVANNLNDISKDNPNFVLQICSEWLMQNDTNVNWVIKHGLRTLVKAGDARVFPLLGFAQKPDVNITQFILDKKQVALGGEINFSFKLSGGDISQCLVVDYVVYFMKANGKLSPKVFKLKNIQLAAHQAVILKKKHSFKKITTRAYYTGLHHVAIHVNGKEIVRQDFELHF